MHHQFHEFGLSGGVLGNIHSLLLKDGIQPSVEKIAQMSSMVFIHCLQTMSNCRFTYLGNKIPQGETICKILPGWKVPQFVSLHGAKGAQGIPGGSHKNITVLDKTQPIGLDHLGLVKGGCQHFNLNFHCP
jgi:hypothetical protein